MNQSNRYRVDALIFAPEERPHSPYIVVDTHVFTDDGRPGYHYRRVAESPTRGEAESLTALLNSYEKKLQCVTNALLPFSHLDSDSVRECADYFEQGEGALGEAPIRSLRVIADLADEARAALDDKR